MLCVGEFWCGFEGLSLCSVWDSLFWILGSECVLCVGQIFVCLG